MRGNKFKIFKNSKANMTCFVCGKNKHVARDCRHYKVRVNEANATSHNDEIIAAVTKFMVINGKVHGRWYDTCATIHASHDKSSFKIYVEVIDI